MRCSSCGSENGPGAKFCSECSAPLQLHCPTCGTPNRPTAKFCADCSALLLPVAPVPPQRRSHIPLQPIALGAPLDPRGDQAERRHLSILFCDLVGSTEIAARLDPEDWRDLIGSYHAAATEAVEHFGGHVALYLGDGLLVYFGYPRAHEDDAQRAVLAGLAILDAMSSLNRRSVSEQRPKLATRIGIHTGPVIVGESSGRGADVFGDVPIVASRVQNFAAPDTVFMTAATHQLVSGLFILEDQGATLLKGIEHPVQLYRVIQPSGVRGRLAAAVVRGLTPFIGRENDLRFLTMRWDQARRGEGQVILVVGEPGIGKSRFVQRFHELLTDTPHTWVDCAAAALHQNTPFYTVTDLLKQGSRWRGEASADERLAGLEASLRLAGAKLSEAVPLIAPLLNLPVPAEYPPLQMPPEQQRKRLLATIAAWALGIARVQPLVIAIEDLHWADPSTLDAIQLLAEQVATAPLLLICTARLEFRVPWPLRTHHGQLTLNRLSASDVEEIVTRLAAQAALPPATVEAVVRRSGGVPLFAEELTRALLKSGEADPSARDIPATLHDLLMARLDRLGSARKIAQLGSVIGDEFSWGLLRAVAPIEDERLEAELRKLADAELLFEQGSPPEASYRFRHALVQDAAYQSLLRSKRHLYHGRIARTLEEQFSEIAEAQPELLAYHYTEADLKKQAIRYWQTAGQKAAERSANAEAVSHLSKGLELLMTLPEDAERLQQELAVQLALGTPLIATKGFGSPEVGQVYARARELCRQAGGTVQLFPVLWGLWVFYTARAEHKAAHELGEQCRRVAEAAQDPDLVMEAHHALGVTLFALGEFSSSLEHLEQAIALYDPHRHGPMAFIYGQDSGVVCRSHAALVLWLLGHPDQALKQNEESLALARELSHPYSMTVALTFAAWLHQLVRDRRLTEERAEAGLTVSTENNFPFWIGMGMILRSWALAEQQPTKDRIAEMRQGLTAFRATGAEVMAPYYLALLAEAHGKTGQIDEGLALLTEAQKLADDNDEHWWEAELFRLKGELTLKQSAAECPEPQSREEAEKSLQQAIEIAWRQNAKSLHLRAAVSLSRLWQTQGKGAEAYLLLAEVYGWFTEGFDTEDLQEAKALLMEVS